MEKGKRASKLEGYTEATIEIPSCISWGQTGTFSIYAYVYTYIYIYTYRYVYLYVQTKRTYRYKHMSYHCQNSSKGVIYGSIVGVIKRDNRSLDYGSYAKRNGEPILKGHFPGSVEDSQLKKVTVQLIWSQTLH